MPKTQYAKTADGVNIAYQVVGEGPLDLIWVQGFVSHVELVWEEPAYARFLNRLASFSRLILIDKRGTGLSDRVPTDALPSLEQRMDDVRAVMDAAGSERAALFGISEGGCMCALFAATYPERTRALVMYGGYPTFLRDADAEWGWDPEELEQGVALLEALWADAGESLSVWAPSMADDPAARTWWGKYLRMSASPGAAAALIKMNMAVDIRGVLPVISVPTLVIHRKDDQFIRVEASRYIAGHIPGARLVELPGEDHLWFWGDQDAITGEVQEFLTGVRQPAYFERSLATVLFTDIVDSTQKAAELGDHRWADVVGEHHRRVRELLARYRGVEVDTAGDGFFSSFDGPARAVRCAQAIVEAVRPLGLGVRAGLHTGEVETIDGKVGGLAVVIGSRIAATSASGEIRTSSTVKDLVAGSGLVFEEVGEFELKGVPDRWRLHRVVA